MRATALAFPPPQLLRAFAKSALAACKLAMPLFVMPGSSILPDSISWGVDSGLLQALSNPGQATRYPLHDTRPICLRPSPGSPWRFLVERFLPDIQRVHSVGRHL